MLEFWFRAGAAWPGARVGGLAVLAALAGCDGERPDAASGGDRERGRLVLQQFGCGSCHEIPGVAGANGRVGPPLGNVAERVYLAGVLPNSPQNMVRWIRDPQRFEPGTAMPDLAVSEANAADMAAYLRSMTE